VQLTTLSPKVGSAAMDQTSKRLRQFGADIIANRKQQLGIVTYCRIGSSSPSITVSAFVDVGASDSKSVLFAAVHRR